MGNFSQTTIEKIKLEVRRLMVREPGISGRRIAELLGYDRDFICKLKKKIDRELKMNLERSLIEDELSEFENIYKAMAIDMYAIITSNSKDSDKIKAFEALMNGKERLIQQKMDAGYFTRKLGEVGIKQTLTPEQNEILTRALNYATERANRASNRINQTGQEPTDRISE